GSAAGMSVKPLTVKIADQTFTRFSRVEFGRDLKEIAGKFDLTIVDSARLKAALLNTIGLPVKNPVVKQGDAVEIAIGGDKALGGWLEIPSGTWDGERIHFRVEGRDKTGDLIDCAALPFGPTEFHGADLLYVAKLVCERFGISVRADVDIGAPFQKLAL